MHGRQQTRFFCVYVLVCQRYNTDYTGVTWETCSLCIWLNGTFLNSAFTPAERAFIPTVTVSADANPNYSTNPGNDAGDQVFLLSITEADNYFVNNTARQCIPTAYAITEGCYVNSNNGLCWWWLRSPGINPKRTVRVLNGGSVGSVGSLVTYVHGAVRPALWINL